MLTTQSYGSEMDPRGAVSTVWYELHHQQETVDFLHAFSFVLYHRSCCCTENRAVGKLEPFVYCLPEGPGLELKSLSICWNYCINWGASCSNNCNIVLYNSCLSIVAVICFITLLWSRDLVNFLQPEGLLTLGGTTLGSWFFTCICLAFYEALFTLVCFALELSILE